MKKISFLFKTLFATLFLSSTVFGASMISLAPATTVPPSDATVTTNGISIDPAATPDKLTLHNALNDFKSLSKSEKKSRIKEAKAAVKEFKKNKKEGRASGDNNTLLEVIVTILLPPVGVLIHEGTINGKFWLDLLLTLLFYIPGLIYGLIVVLSND